MLIFETLSAFLEIEKKMSFLLTGHIPFKQNCDGL